MKKITTICYLIFVFVCARAQNAEFEWTKHFKEGGSQGNILPFIHFDADGDLYFVGSFLTNLDFMGVTYIIPQKSTAHVKMRQDGTLEWMKVAESGFYAEIVTDANKKCYSGGNYTGSLVISPFTLNQTPGIFGQTSYYATLDSMGTFLSATNIYSGESFMNSVSKLSANQNGDVVYVDSRGVFIDLAVGYVPYYNLTKKNQSGTTWTKSFLKTPINITHLNELNETLIAGNFTTTFILNGTTLTNSGLKDIYLAKLDANGIYQWVKKIGGTLDDNLVNIRTDNSGNYLISGTFTSDSIQIDDVVLYSTGGYTRSFVAKLNSSGVCQWAKILDNGIKYYVKDIYFNETDSTTYATGTFSETLTLNEDTLFYSPDKYRFIMQLDKNGNKIGQLQYTMPTTVIGNSTRFYDDKTLYVYGYFNNIATFGDETFTALNTQDGFISKINFCMESTTYFADNDNDGYGDAAGLLEGCNPIAGYVLNSNDCDDANGDVYPGATEICNVLDDNCDGLIDDSIINTDLTISGPTTFCKGSNVTLNAEVVVGNNYQWKKNGSTIPGAVSSNYTASKSGNYEVTISTMEGCSATSAVIPVTVFNTPAATINNLDGTNNLCVDASIKLKANAGAGYTYQWTKNGVDIAGATTQVYFATAIGNYRVRVTNAEGCSKNSAVVAIINACKSETPIDSKDFSISPNPNTGIFTIILKNELQQESPIPLIIYDMLGNQVYAIDLNINELNNNNTITLPTNISSGLYLVTLNLTSGVIRQTIEIIK